ncbi:hypothetical protein [Borreliella burgdorferi]
MAKKDVIKSISNVVKVT